MPLDWQYTRTNRRHECSDGESYDGRNLFEIVDCAPYRAYHLREHGYDLYHRGKKVAHAKTVKELKLKAEELV